MNSPTTLSYPRAPSENLQDLLLDGFLVPILNLHGRQVGDCRLDVHFRSEDEIHVYIGSARILRIKRKSDKTIEVDVDDHYKEGISNSDLFRTWNTKEPKLAESIEDYLTEGPVSTLLIDGESKVQDIWSRIRDPWIPFDHEAALHYESKATQASQAKVTEVEMARSILREIANYRPGRKRWREPKKPLASKRIDQLGVDQAGNLVLIELKDANSKNQSSVFYAPLQILEYVHEWYIAFRWEHIRAQVKDLISARQQLEIMPKTTPLTGGLRAAICFGEDARSEEVKRRFYEALGVVNAHLPPGVPPVETWCIDKNKPQAL